MTKLFGPFNNGVGASMFEAQWSNMMRTIISDGVVKSYLNELEIYADSTGMQVKAKTGGGWIKGHYYQNDAEETLALTTANPTLGRWDLVVLEVDWTKSDNQMSVVVIAGTPAASPALPSLTQSTSKWQIALAKVVVGAGVTTINAGNITDSRNMVCFPYKQLWVGGFKPTKTAGCGLSAQIEMGTNKNVLDYLPFDPNTIEYAYANVPLPQDYTGGAVYFQPYWLHPTTTTNFKVSWGLAAVAVADAGNLDVAQGTPIYSNDDGGTANYQFIGPKSAGVTIAGTPAAGKMVQFRALRKADDATNDTLAVDAYLLGFLVWYPVR